MVLCVVLIHLLNAPGCALADRQEIRRKAEAKQQTPEWGTATFRGLTIGKSTRVDMSRVLGEPQWSGPPGDQQEDDLKPQVWNEYKDGGDIPGKVTVVVDEQSGVILRVDLYPEDLSRKEAARHFGENYVITRYAFDDCLGDGESSPVYESPSGPLVNMEYRERGIAVALDDNDRVNHLSYVSEPIGARSSRCKGEGQSP